MRVYVPATVEILQQLVADQEFDPMSRTAFAVTPTLRESYAAGDDDELAEVAMGEAARASLRLIAGTEGDVTFRRAVVAADVDDADVKLRPDLDDSVVRLAGPVTMAQVASVHVDLEQAESDIERAAGIVDAADLGDAEDHELAWYAAQELPFLLDLL